MFSLRTNLVVTHVIKTNLLRKVIKTMTENQDKKNLSVDSTVSLKGIVKAIFKDTIHVQIGGKIITLPISGTDPKNLSL